MSRIIENLEALTSEILFNNDMYTIPIDVIRIAKANDIKVYEADLEKNVSGAIGYNDKTECFEILVNSGDSRARQRFTIAHELAHYFMHKDILQSENGHVDILYRTEKTQDEIKREREADYFAGALLMNKTLLVNLRSSYNIKELAELFEVSVSAMTVRLDTLGIL